MCIIFYFTSLYVYYNIHYLVSHTAKRFIFIQPEVQQQRLNKFSRILCTVRGNPPPIVRWRKNGEIVFPDDPRIKVATNTTSDETVLSELTITSVTRDDNGTYEYEAFDKLGDLRKSSRLLVLGKIFYEN